MTEERTSLRKHKREMDISQRPTSFWWGP